MKINKGFTLAEVLVTLAIIGIVAALTIPSLISKSNEEKYKTGLKKNISVLNSALKTNLANNEVDAGDTSITSDNELARWFATGSVVDTTPKNLSALKLWGSSIWLADGARISFYLADGASAGCGAIVDPKVLNIATGKFCWAWIDTNGDKPPNTLATATKPSDIYLVGISNNSVVPAILTFGTTVYSYYDINNNLIKNIFVMGSQNASYSVMTGAT